MLSIYIVTMRTFVERKTPTALFVYFPTRLNKIYINLILFFFIKISLKITFRLNSEHNKKYKTILTDSMFSVLSQGKSVIYNIFRLIWIVFNQGWTRNNTLDALSLSFPITKPVNPKFTSF